ncbi:uncharacterized protein LOC110937737 [Helianthus annuus]|uniref:uncharacterized protein LOC110937737 n=1 Tax=Helianthus annuus TaxID=4232 RepID=UPI001652C9C3|nr:uncharacterized protein LOC110937737 [Helianthus annuus]
MLVTYFHLFGFQQVLGLETEIRMLKSLDLKSLGLSNRRTRTTSINMESLCSHSVFTCVIESKCKEGQGLNCSEYLQADLLDILKRERHSGLVKYTYLCQKSGFFAFDHEDSSVLDVQQAPISCFNGFLLMFSELSNAMKMGTLSKSESG